MSINVYAEHPSWNGRSALSPRHQPEIIVWLYIGKMELVVDTELFPPGEFSFQHIHHEFIHYHIRGIAGERGLAYLEQIQNQPYAQ